MRELLDLLGARDFLVFICSGGGRDFMRPVSEQMYGIPRERVIGSAATVQYRDGELQRTRDVEQPIDDGTGKPEHIWMRTGRKPLLACGNARQPRVRLRHRRGEGSGQREGTRLDGRQHAKRLQGGV